MILNDETVDNLTNDDHYRNLLKILNWNGYSYWDKNQAEKLYLLDQYNRYVIRGVMMQQYPGGSRFPIDSIFDEFCQEVL